MSNGAVPPDNSDVWGQILFEARELRRKQDARLAVVQRLSHLVVAGFLAMAAIVVAAVSSPNIKTPADTGVALWVLLGTAVVNSLVWYLVHERSRQWQEAPDIGHLMETFPRRVDGLARLQRHLVKTFMTEFRYNEKLVGSTQRIVTTQTFLTLGSLCFVGLVLFEIL